VSGFLRLARWALLGAALGCSRPAQTSADAGLPVTRAARLAEQPLPGAGPTGSLVGRVRWLGPKPALPPLQTTVSVRGVCGTQVSDNAFQVGADGGVAEAVVWVDAPAEANAGPAVVLDQRGCLYRPAVLAARAGGTLRLRNSDPLTHTVHAVDNGRSIFNVAMPLEHMELSRSLPAQPGVVDIRCDVHPWMRAVVRTFEHSHFTTTTADGHFHLAAVGPGEVVVHAWHPKLGEASRQVHVGPGVTDVDFEFGGLP
jgi:plastocyanin